MAALHQHIERAQNLANDIVLVPKPLAAPDGTHRALSSRTRAISRSLAAGCAVLSLARTGLAHFALPGTSIAMEVASPVAAPLQASPAMQLDQMLDRCWRLEARVAALYRSYAASARMDPSLCALWTALAREEDEHAHSIALARSRLEATEGWRTRLDGWDEALGEVERRLAAAERLPGEASTALQLSAALDLELTELEALRHVLLAACRQAEDDVSAAHAVRLAEAAMRLSDDPQVRLQAALLRARARVKETLR